MHQRVSELDPLPELTLLHTTPKIDCCIYFEVEQVCIFISPPLHSRLPPSGQTLDKNQGILRYPLETCLQCRRENSLVHRPILPPPKFPNFYRADPPQSIDCSFCDLESL